MIPERLLALLDGSPGGQGREICEAILPWYNRPEEEPATEAEIARLASAVVPYLRAGYPWHQEVGGALEFLAGEAREGQSLPRELLEAAMSVLRKPRPLRAARRFITQEEHSLLVFLSVNPLIQDTEREEVWEFVRQEQLREGEWGAALIEGGSGPRFWGRMLEERRGNLEVRTALARYAPSRQDPVVRSALLSSSDPLILEGLLYEAPPAEFRTLLLRLVRRDPKRAAEALERATDEQRSTLGLREQQKLLSSSEAALRLEAMRLAPPRRRR